MNGMGHLPDFIMQVRLPLGSILDESEEWCGVKYLVLE